MNGGGKVLSTAYFYSGSEVRRSEQKKKKNSDCRGRMAHVHMAGKYSLVISAEIASLHVVFGGSFSASTRVLYHSLRPAF